MLRLNYGYRSSYTINICIVTTFLLDDFRLNAQLDVYHRQNDIDPFVVFQSFVGGRDEG